MKRLFTQLIVLLASLPMLAQGWPEKYEGVMLQGFYWDSFSQSKWVKLEKQADELSQYFKLVWIPQSGNCDGLSMGYNDLYWFPGDDRYTSSFGNEKELRSMISTFKQKGIGTIADVVVNHRRTLNLTFNFPKEEYNGTIYEMKSTDICADDLSYWTDYDGQSTKSWADSKGVTISSNKDTGEGWDGMPDLDHKSENVQKIVKAYLKMLLEDLGYTGFRYDVAKGFSASYFGQYNDHAQPAFSVGEYWDGDVAKVRAWIDGTGKKSAAFDFPFRYTVRDAINNNNWKSLANNSLISYDSYKRYSVTFVENHDTEKRSNREQDPIKKDTLAANAYLLAMPGTPCVFFRHWIDCKQDIKAMIDVRNAVGIHNQSESFGYASHQNYYAVGTTGSKGEMLALVGSKIADYTPNAKFVKVLSGYHYAYYMSKSMETAWVDLPSGEYEGKQQATLTAVSASDAQLVYTTDGTDPTSSSKKVASGTKIDIEGDITLKVGLLIGSTVSGIVTRTYSQPVPEDTHDITVYVKNPGWTDMYFYMWDAEGEQWNGGWPGKKITDKKTIDGEEWFYQTFTLPASITTFNMVFNQGNGKPQTVDVNGITSDSYFLIGNKSGDKYTVTKDETMGIQIVKANSISNGPVKVYTLDGRMLRQLPAGSSVQDAMSTLPRGLYLINGKKYVK
jgi:alpha-amylase